MKKEMNVMIWLWQRVAWAGTMLRKRMSGDFAVLGKPLLLLLLMTQIPAAIWRFAVIPKAVLKAQLAEMTWTVATPYGYILQHNTPTAHELIQAASASEMNFWMSQVVGVIVILFPVAVLLFFFRWKRVKKMRSSDGDQHAVNGNQTLKNGCS